MYNSIAVSPFFNKRRSFSNQFLVYSSLEKPSLLHQAASL
jgi:hypothetical protein